MSDDGSTKDDVKIPDGETGDKIHKMFTEDGKDTSRLHSGNLLRIMLTYYQTLLSLLLWVRRPASTPRKLPNKRIAQCVDCLAGSKARIADRLQTELQHSLHISCKVVAPRQAQHSPVQFALGDQCTRFFGRFWVLCIAMCGKRITIHFPS
jgi:hypothetical protein